MDSIRLRAMLFDEDEGLLANEAMPRPGWVNMLAKRMKSSLRDARALELAPWGIVAAVLR